MGEPDFFSVLGGIPLANGRLFRSFGDGDGLYKGSTNFLWLFKNGKFIAPPEQVTNSEINYYDQYCDQYGTEVIYYPNKNNCNELSIVNSNNRVITKDVYKHEDSTCSKFPEFNGDLESYSNILYSFYNNTIYIYSLALKEDESFLNGFYDLLPVEFMTGLRLPVDDNSCIYYDSEGYGTSVGRTVATYRFGNHAQSLPMTLTFDESGNHTLTTIFDAVCKGEHLKVVNFDFKNGSIVLSNDPEWVFKMPYLKANCRYMTSYKIAYYPTGDTPIAGAVESDACVVNYGDSKSYRVVAPPSSTFIYMYWETDCFETIDLWSPGGGYSNYTTHSISTYKVTDIMLYDYISSIFSAKKGTVCAIDFDKDIYILQTAKYNNNLKDFSITTTSAVYNIDIDDNSRYILYGIREDSILVEKLPLDYISDISWESIGIRVNLSFSHYLTDTIKFEVDLVNGLWDGNSFVNWDDAVTITINNIDILVIIKYKLRIKVFFNRY